MYVIDIEQVMGTDWQVSHTRPLCRLVVIGHMYIAYPDGCRHEFTFLLRVKRYPIMGHRFLCLCLY